MSNVLLVFYIKQLYEQVYNLMYSGINCKLSYVSYFPAISLKK